MQDKLLNVKLQVLPDVVSSRFASTAHTAAPCANGRNRACSTPTSSSAAQRNAHIESKHQHINLSDKQTGHRSISLKTKIITQKFLYKAGKANSDFSLKTILSQLKISVKRGHQERFVHLGWYELIPLN